MPTKGPPLNPRKQPRISRAFSASRPIAGTHEALKSADPGLVVLDVPQSQRYAEGHVPGALESAARKINDRNLAAYGADKGALRLSRLGRRVKKMIG